MKMLSRIIIADFLKTRGGLRDRRRRSRIEPTAESERKTLSMRGIQRHLALQVLLWALASISAAAQANNLVLKVADLKPADYSGYEYTEGEPFKLNVDYAKLSSADQRRLRARIFRGTVASLINKRAGAGGCLTYNTSLFTPLLYFGGLEFRLNFDEAWLRRSRNGLAEEHFLIVFELDGPDSSRLDLDRNFANIYFQLGFPFVVRPDRSLSSRETAINGPSEGRSGSSSTSGSRPSERERSQQPPCWSIQVVTTSSATYPLPQQIACRTDRTSWLSRLFGR